MNELRQRIEFQEQILLIILSNNMKKLRKETHSLIIIIILVSKCESCSSGVQYVCMHYNMMKMCCAGACVDRD